MSKLPLNTLSTLSSVLETLPFAVAVFDRDSTLVAANHGSHVVWPQPGATEGRVARALDRVLSNGEPEFVLEGEAAGAMIVSIRRTADQEGVAIALPLRWAASDLGAMRTLYGTSEAETRVVCRLLSGSTPREIAAHCGVSLHTIRTHMKNLFRKTGVHSQPELAVLATIVAILQTRSGNTAGEGCSWPDRRL